MKILKVLRHVEWWEYKLPPLLAIAYATLLQHNNSIFEQSLYICLALLSLITGAIYVSIINDLADIDDDAAAGKINRMADLPDFVKFILPAACLLMGAAFLAWLYWPDYLSCIFYSLPWVAFSMYSFKPVRLKNRGVLGLLADAGGAHIFTSLLMASYMYFRVNEPVNSLWMCLIAVWATCYGIRGILWHQFYDRENDIRANIKTFATKRNPERFKKTEIFILSIEVISITGILLFLDNIFAYAAFVLYLILVWIRYKKLHLLPVIIIEYRRPCQIFMQDFVQVFFPLSLLLYAAVTQPYGWIILLIHLLLFPFRPLQVLKDLKKAL